MAGLLDWLNTPQGTGLLSAAASYAANARRGTPVNNIGRGLAGGLAGYQSAQQGIVDAERQQQENEYRKAMMQAQMMNAQTAAQNAETKRKKAFGDATGEAKVFQNVFGVPVQVVDTGGEEFDYMPAGYQSDFIDIKDAKEVKPPPQFQVNEQMAKMYGFTPEDLNYISGLYQVDPKAAVKEMSAIRAANRKGRTEAKDVLAKERAMAEAMGMPLSQYLKDKSSRSGVNVTVPVNVSAGEAAKTQGKEFGKFAVEATQAAQNAADMAGDVGMIYEGLKGMGGGPVAEFKGWAGRYFPADSDWGKVASMGELAKTVQAKIAPQLRAVGSGATSDFEMRMYMQAIPTLSTTENGRALMAKYANRVAERAQVRAEIINNIEQQGRLPTPKEVNDQMKARLRDKFFDQQDEAFFGIGGKSAQQAAKPDAESFNMLPNAKQYDGRTITDSQTGKKYKSVNGKWVEAR